MLRLLILTLVLANGLYFAWSQGLLRELGFAPAAQSEPQRLAQQLHPEGLRILRPEEVRRLESAPASVPPAVAINPPECLQAGLFDTAQAEVLRGRLLATLPPGSWLMEPAVEPARWIVYMGKYPNPQALAKKRGELASLDLKFEPVTNPSLQYGVSLAAYPSQEGAVKALAGFTRRGVRTARVVQERAEVRGAMLRLAAADDSIKARLEEFKGALAGKPLRSCK